MDAMDIVEQIGPYAVDTLDSVPPVPVDAGRWLVLWLQYVPLGSDESGERVRVHDACLLDEEAVCAHVPVDADVTLPPAGDEPAPLVDETLPSYLTWLAGVAGDGTTTMDDALARSGSLRLRPLYEAALLAAERPAEGGE